MSCCSSSSTRSSWGPPCRLPTALPSCCCRPAAAAAQQQLGRQFQQPPSAAAVKLVSMALANQQRSQAAAGQPPPTAAGGAAAQVADLLATLQEQHKLPQAPLASAHIKQQPDDRLHSLKQPPQCEQRSSAASSYLTGSPAGLGHQPHPPMAPLHPAYPSALAQHMYGLPMSASSLHSERPPSALRHLSSPAEPTNGLLADKDDEYWQSHSMHHTDQSALALAQKTLGTAHMFDTGLADKSPLQQLQAALATNGADGCSEQTLSLLTGLPFAEGLLASDGLGDQHHSKAHPLLSRP